jgi:hypothetical protein
MIIHFNIFDDTVAYSPNLKLTAINPTVSGALSQAASLEFLPAQCWFYQTRI